MLTRLKKDIQFLVIFIGIIFQSGHSQTWNNLINGAGSGFSDVVLALCADSSTNELYVGGTFNTVSGQPFTNLAKWNGTTWSDVGADGGVTAIAKINGNVYASGSFATIGGVTANRAAKFNGTIWQPLGNGVNSAIYSFAWYNGMLYAGGGFSGVNGFSTAANHIATWNGVTWAPVGAGANNGTTATGCCFSGDANTLCVYNGNLYVGGEFLKAGGVTANCIAKWNGATWSGVGGGINTYVTSLVVYNNELYAGGNFTTAGGVTAHNIARWNGAAWSAVGPPTILNNPIWSMEVINNELYVAGSFSGVITSGTSKFVAKWNGTSWNNVTTGPGTDNVSFAIAGVPTGWVYVGGAFMTGDGNSNDVHIARLFISTPLPIEITSFTGKHYTGKNILSWTTVSETNSDYFEIQKSNDAENFYWTGKINAAGNYAYPIHYNYTDENILDEINYYRLKEVDFDGRQAFSKIISLNANSDIETAISIYPNPASGELQISGLVIKQGEVIELKIFDLMSQEIYSFPVKTSDFKLKISNFPNGIYLIHAVKNNEVIFAQKLIIQK